VGLTERIARACAAHPGRTLGAWGVVFVLSIAAVLFVLTGLTTEASGTNNPESERADELMFSAFPFEPNSFVSDVVVVHSDRYRVTDPRFRAVVTKLYSDLQASRAIESGRTFYAARDRSLVSRDRRTTIMPVFVTDDMDGAERTIDLVRRADADPAFVVGVTGNQIRDHDSNHLSESDLRNGELKFGVPAALVVLLAVFGTVVAALVPLLLAIVAIVFALGLIALTSQVFELSIYITNMLLGMGFALGIDYSLFIISRYREERRGGRGPDAAIAVAGATASRAVLFSGSAFVVAMIGLLIVPSTIFRSLAAGAIFVGITSVIAALTLLPGLLGAIHDRVNSLRLPYLGKRALTPESPFWRAVVVRVLRRPVLSLAISCSALLALALPVLGLHVGSAGVSTLPDDLASKQGYLALQRYFTANTPDPVHVLVADASSSDVNRALTRLRRELAGDPRFGEGTIRRNGAVADLAVPVRGDPAGEDAISAVRDLRDEVIPAVFDRTDAEPLVGGTTSENIDYIDGVTNPAPVVFAFVLGLTFVLLTVAFRSIAVALTAIVLNLLSVGAAYGLLVIVFQHGVGADLLGFRQVDIIEAWVPLFLFSVLFGLSMDYQVFLLSRIRERFDQTRDTREAVTWGVASTARVITGAALIIVAVFWGFARGELVMFQQMGFGIAVSLLIDATVIRSIVLPSVMGVLGDRIWYLPGWLDWIPHLEIEGHAAAEAG
jgi:putative drug exporter of the RND superfamily